jgi:pentapeptide MXKDX repeat protein
VLLTPQLTHIARDLLNAPYTRDERLAPPPLTPGQPEPGGEGGDALGKDALGKDALGKDALGKDALGKDALGKDALGEDALGEDALGEDALGEDALGEDALGEDALGVDALDTAFAEAAGAEAAGAEAAGEKGWDCAGGASNGPASKEASPSILDQIATKKANILADYLAVCDLRLSMDDCTPFAQNKVAQGFKNTLRALVEGRTQRRRREGEAFIPVVM